MKERLEKLAARIDGMTLRERLMLFLSTVAILFMLWNNLFLSTIDLQLDREVKTMEGMQKEIGRLQGEVTATIERSRFDPNTEQRTRLARYQQQVGAVEQAIRSAIQGLIDPQQMVRVLEQVLNRNTDLRLLSISNLGSERLIKPDPEQPEEELVDIYRHDLQLVMEGNYLSALAYLEALQGLDWQLYWDGIEVTMGDYPNARVTITVHTLSLGEGWIGV